MDHSVLKLRFQWHRASRPKANALVIHGLNLPPDRMSSIISRLNQLQVSCLNLSLSGHYGTSHKANPKLAQFWEQEVEFAHREIQKENLPYLYVGYSLGGLLLASQLQLANQLRPKACVFFSPAFYPKITVKTLGLIGKYAPSFKIKSVNFKSYRYKDFCFAHDYKILCQQVEKLKLIDFPTLCFYHPKDEALSFDKLEAHLLKHNFNNWKMIPLNLQQQALPRPIKHLTITPEACGEAVWEGIWEEISTLLKR